MLLAAFVDLINRTRGDHVITLENRITVVHESRSSLVSQREVRGDTEQLLGALRAALRESPDVIVVEDLRGADVVAEALEAAASGHLVIGALAAHSASTALERIVDQAPPERRPQFQALLGESLRGVVAQVLLRKTGGGRIAARELLLNSSSVAQLIADGKLTQLPLAMEGGRRVGMVPLTDALVAFVQSGVVEVREAYRKAPDRAGLLKALKREGIDTSFVERLA
jgi:twitching motility protein PilT